ncbi:DUF952 domain-containing protein [Rhodovulum sp. DZ06]|uniref:DUF952 domain-containing protein n=1 Tax=Rhodovulum sp. DZ06 TaxID=3425126 RepID=UPI003D3452D5
MIYKILRAAEWASFQEKGAFSGAPVDIQDGFIHLSNSEQVAETARKHFAAETGLALLAVEERSLGDALKWEVSRGGALFPHLYADLKMSQVAWAAPLPLGPDGAHVFPELDA